MNRKMLKIFAVISYNLLGAFEENAINLAGTNVHHELLVFALTGD